MTLLMTSLHIITGFSLALKAEGVALVCHAQKMYEESSPGSINVTRALVFATSWERSIAWRWPCHKT